MSTTEFSFDLLDFLGGHKALADSACPACGPGCRSAINRRRKVLRIWNDGEFITYRCARCEAAGYAKADGAVTTTTRRPVIPADPRLEQDKSELAAYLWAKSVPLITTVAERYLASRGCLVDSAALRFMPARGGHPPAMIARFGDAARPTGVHLTKLKPDGSGKAGTDKDKIMIGASQGQPIVIADNPDREELVIAEGIEDAASIALVTGWSAWAAGSAGRIAPVVAAAPRSMRVYLASDLDWGKKDRVRAGPRALKKSREVRPDLVPLHFEKALGIKIDANEGLVKFGPDAIIAAIEWCDAQARYAQGEIGFEAMMRLSNHAQRLLNELAEAD